MTHLISLLPAEQRLPVHFLYSGLRCAVLLNADRRMYPSIARERANSEFPSRTYKEVNGK